MLIDRLLRLLLTGTDPKRILCITYTKAAANEMRERLQHTLLSWSKASSDTLQRELLYLEQKALSQKHLHRARNLFHTLLDHPLAIQTIHSFCQKILRLFPLEAGIHPDFDVLDDVSAHTLKEKAMKRLLQTEDYTHFLENIGQSMSEFYLKECLMEALSSRTKIHPHGGANRKAFFEGLFLNPSLDTVLSTKDNETIFYLASLTEQYGAKSVQEKAKHVLQCTPSYEWGILSSLFLTSEGRPRAKASTKKLLENCPDFDEQFQTIATKILRNQEQQEIQKALLLNDSFDVLLSAVIAFYTHEKQRMNALDFDDLIMKTDALLKSHMAWVKHELDGGFDHILIDEAQDTSPDQWSIIKELTTHFFDSPATLPRSYKNLEKEDHKSLPRTLFVVGDAKQSIYSFQGADPKAYREIKKYFEELLAHAGFILQTISLDTCYRCAPEILKLVDHVCNQKSITPSLLHSWEITHRPHRQDEQGHVGVWPLIPVTLGKTTNEEDLGWQLYPTPLYRETPEEQLASMIARRIRQLLNSKTILSSTQKPIQANDIFILLRRRGKLMTMLSKALADNDIQSICQDQRAFLEHLYIKDFLAFLAFLDCPYDDLNLACLLKSPTFGISENDLMRLCYAREKPLWERLKEELPYEEHAAFLNYFMEMYQKDDMYSLAYVYLHMTYERNKSSYKEGSKGQTPYLMELMEQLLNLTLDTCMKRRPTALDLKNTIEKHPPLFKRRTEHGVQLMTIHGSKGLQAPVVILADTGDNSVLTHSRILFTEDFHILRQRTHTLKVIKELEKSSLDAENHRLLYVALTRAQDRLYITGIDRGMEECWYSYLEPFVNQEQTLCHFQP